VGSDGSTHDSAATQSACDVGCSRSIHRSAEIRISSADGLVMR
jgi:hypothetical protein